MEMLRLDYLLNRDSHSVGLEMDYNCSYNNSHRHYKRYNMHHKHLDMFEESENTY